MSQELIHAQLAKSKRSRAIHVSEQMETKHEIWKKISNIIWYAKFFNSF